MHLRQLSLILAMAVIFASGCADWWPFSEFSERERRWAEMRAQGKIYSEATNQWLRDDGPCPLPAAPTTRRESRAITLNDLDLVMRKVDFAPPIDSIASAYFSETEITNQQYAWYLDDTGQWRDDSELANLPELTWASTGLRAINIDAPESLWRQGRFPVGRDDHPVTLVTTGQAVDFCDWLNDRYKLPGTFRLPTDDEWLFAAYGRNRNYPWGNDERPWHGASTEPVRARPDLRTPDGLFGMWGNVSELVISRETGYGQMLQPGHPPMITLWLGASYQPSPDLPPLPRQDYWGYTHSTQSCSDSWGFRVVFVTDDAEN